MKSKDKLAVTAKKMPDYDDKLWVFVELLNGKTDWVPSFEDLYRVIQAICFCEDRKYPKGQGRYMVRDFLNECCQPLKEGQTLDERWAELCYEYAIPVRRS